MEILLLSSIGLIIYCYAGYPLTLCFLSRVIPRTVQKGDVTPSVSVLISVWNEEDVMEGKIRNLLSLSYPKKKLEIVIGSDGSTDRTNEIVKRFADQRVRLIINESRQGKALTINRLASEAKNEILILTDARQKFEKDAILQLVSNFSDKTVGCVSAELVFSWGEGGGTAKGINLYWNYEKFIRLHESRIHSMLGATGAIYAIRRELFTDIPEKLVLDDMFVPLKIIRKGYRAIFDETARAYDKVADSPKEEYRRKTRTLYGNYQIFGYLPSVFNPFSSPVAIQMFSHKLLRLIVPFLMIAAFILNILLIDHDIYRVLLALQIAFYVMAVLGALSRYQNYGILKFVSKLCYVPYVFCLLNFAALVGLLRYLTGGQEVTWQKARTMS